jgi:xanthine phosphoribosyltransferase
MQQNKLAVHRENSTTSAEGHRTAAPRSARSCLFFLSQFNRSMKMLHERILELGYVLPGDILNVNAFLNHQLDTKLLVQISKTFAEHFSHRGLTKIVTVETSGIAAAVTTGIELQVPVVFARKAPASTIGSDHYSAPAYSYTKQLRNDVVVSRLFIGSQDRLLVVDDFLARGEALSALTSIINQASATLTGIGIVIEKAFQGGGEKIRAAGHEIFALARIKSLCPPNQIEFLD